MEAYRPRVSAHGLTVLGRQMNTDEPSAAYGRNQRVFGDEGLK